MVIVCDSLVPAAFCLLSLLKVSGIRVIHEHCNINDTNRSLKGMFCRVFSFGLFGSRSTADVTEENRKGTQKKVIHVC